MLSIKMGLSTDGEIQSYSAAVNSLTRNRT
jgi:hypothetical protein